MTVVTRFAPSPTGYLHIGGARTALFNWLYAKHCRGKFLLRVEDTDLTRSTEDAKRKILEGLEWLGLHWDGEVVYQTSRSARHREVAEELVKRGAAYYCYATPEELATQRAEAEAKGEMFRYNRFWRDKTSADAPADRAGAIRIKAPLTGEIVVHDLVQGEVRFPADALDDFIILRSDGTPTYMHAVVVDDHDMGVTHIIRGDDHLNNAGRQTIIYQAMGWNIPDFAHIPLIHGTDGAKLSKRHGALGVEAYRDMGYLPEGLVNYLLRLGWGHGDEELIPLARAIELFDITGIGKAPARMDFAKLNHVNAHYLREKPDAELANMIGAPHLARAMGALKQRAHTVIELKEAAKFYLERPTGYDEKAAASLAKARDFLPLLLEHMTAIADWSAATIKTTITAFASTSGKKPGEVMPPLRAAIVGAMSGPDIPEAMEILGREESLARIRDAASLD